MLSCLVIIHAFIQQFKNSLFIYFWYYFPWRGFDIKGQREMRIKKGYYIEDFFGKSFSILPPLHVHKTQKHTHTHTHTHTNTHPSPKRRWEGCQLPSA